MKMNSNRLPSNISPRFRFPTPTAAATIYIAIWQTSGRQNVQASRLAANWSDNMRPTGRAATATHTDTDSDTDTYTGAATLLYNYTDIRTLYTKHSSAAAAPEAVAMGNEPQHFTNNNSYTYNTYKTAKDTKTTATQQSSVRLVAQAKKRRVKCFLYSPHHTMAK